MAANPPLLDKTELRMHTVKIGIDFDSITWAFSIYRHNGAHLQSDQLQALRKVNYHYSCGPKGYPNIVFDYTGLAFQKVISRIDVVVTELDVENGPQGIIRLHLVSRESVFEAEELAAKRKRDDDMSKLVSKIGDSIDAYRLLFGESIDNAIENNANYHQADQDSGINSYWQRETWKASLKQGIQKYLENRIKELRSKLVSDIVNKMDTPVAAKWLSEKSKYHLAWSEINKNIYSANPNGVELRFKFDPREREKFEASLRQKEFETSLRKEIWRCLKKRVNRPQSAGHRADNKKPAVNVMTAAGAGAEASPSKAKVQAGVQNNVNRPQLNRVQEAAGAGANSARVARRLHISQNQASAKATPSRPQSAGHRADNKKPAANVMAAAGAGAEASSSKANPRIMNQSNANGVAVHRIQQAARIGANLAASRRSALHTSQNPVSAKATPNRPQSAVLGSAGKKSTVDDSMKARLVDINKNNISTKPKC